MNLTQAEAIASLYSELLSSIDRSKIPLPEYSSGKFFTIEQLYDISLEDEQVKLHWRRYTGCGEYDTEDTYHALDILFD